MRPATACAGAILCALGLPSHATPDRWEWLGGRDPATGHPKSVSPALPRSTADRADEVSGPQLHLMYVLPSDGLDEQADTDGRIGTSALAFNNWLATQTAGRALRIDTFNGLPDITFHRLSRTDADLRATGAYVRTEIEDALRAAGMIDDAKLYAVYYGGSSSYSCGGGAYPPTLPGNVGAMYLKGEPPGAPPCATNPLGSGIGSPGYFEFGMVHELMHTLGFVAACAPHHHLSGHVFDNANDLMWAGDAPWQLPPRLDIGRDDYYGNGIPGCLDLMASPFLTPPPRLANISTRMQVLTGNDVMIGGFVIGGAANKTVAIVATGPSLAQYGIANALANPTLTLVRQSDQAVLATNDNWQSAANAAAISASGFAPSNTLESAILTTLAPGAYTAVVSGVSGGTGVGVVAVYEVDSPEIPMINISTRGRVLTGNDVMIGGFVILGGSQQVAIVATGPSLAQYGIANVLANPTLTLVRQSDQAVLATNDDWQSAANAAAIQSSGFAPPNAKESAILTTLPPGAYTAILSGVGGGTGVGIIGVYTVP